MELEDDEPSETRLPHSEWTQVRSEDEDNNNTDEYTLQTIKHKVRYIMLHWKLLYIYSAFAQN